jgi:hypothetical protein
VADPVSWLLLERGWQVVDADGQEVGKVEGTVGDSTHDIFNGLTIATGLLAREQYVPAEQVDEITEGRVRLKLRKAELESRPKHDEPPPHERSEP